MVYFQGFMAPAVVVTIEYTDPPVECEEPFTADKVKKTESVGDDPGVKTVFFGKKIDRNDVLCS